MPRRAVRANWTDEQRQAAREYRQRYYSEHRTEILEKARRAREQTRDVRADGHRLSFYGLRPQEFDALVERQDGRCAICHEPPADGVWCVDHDHDCCPGKKSCGRCIRGLLCGPCNRGLGCFGENWETLLTAMLYVADAEAARLTRPPDLTLFDRPSLLAGGGER